MAYPSDIEIAQSTTMRPIAEIAAGLNIDEAYVEQYGRYKAKIDYNLLSDLKDKPDGKLILVTAISPTPAGEGKTTTTVGLAHGLRRHREKSGRHDPPALHGADLRHQGRGGGRRVQPDRPHGRLQPPPHRRHPRGERRAQPLRDRPRRAHVP